MSTTPLPPFAVPFMSPAFNSSWLGVMEFEAHEIGVLKLPSGRLVLCDALADSTAGPLDRVVEAGSYPVLVSVARLEDGDERIAAAMIRFSSRTIIDWELAMPPQAEPLEPGDSDFVGYAVESGTGSFLSAEAADALAHRLDEDPAFHERMVDALKVNYRETRDWAEIDIDEPGLYNGILFSTGLGDGVYPSFWGFDEDGVPVCLITDCGLVDYHDPEP
jgi:hypothetical protein